MKRQGIGNREQGTERQAAGNRQQAAGNRQQATGGRQQTAGGRQQGELESLLRRVVPAVDYGAGPSRDLWPELRRRMDADVADAPVRVAVPWYDWALAAGVLLMAVVSPVSVPVLLYYL